MQARDLALAANENLKPGQRLPPAYPHRVAGGQAVTETPIDAAASVSLMKTAIVVGPDIPSWMAQPTFWIPVADAFKKCLERRGWKVIETGHRIPKRPDLVAGYGWRPVMREAHRQWSDIVLHADLGFWGRSTDRATAYLKLALGGRWSLLVDHDYDDTRLRVHGVKIEKTRQPGKRVLVCGMSAKAAGTWDLRPQQWEEMAVRRLRAAGATVVYRPKQSWSGAYAIPGAEYNRGGEIQQILPMVDAVVSHHSNAAVDALAAGLPIYVQTGISRPLSIPTIEAAVGAEGLDYETRARFLRQVAWHQWRLDELRSGAWLEPPAPLAGNPLFEAA